MFKKIATSLLVLALIPGCATRGSNYVPLVDNKTKNQAELNQDIQECQEFSKQRMDAASGAAAGAVAGALLGALLTPRGYRNQVAGQAAVLGGLGGAAGANETQETITKRCLAGRGYNVLN
jgi:outer membrane lipoprotein SlyB